MGYNLNNYAVITNVNLIDRSKWCEFVYNHPHGNIFQTPEMYEVYQNTKNYEPVFLAVVNSKGEISGTLLAVIQKEYSGVLGNFTARSIIQGGPLLKDDDPHVLDLVLNEYDKIIKEKSIYTEVRNFYDTSNNKKIYEKYGYKYKEHLNILVNLTIGEEALWKELSKKRKQGIRKAKRNDLIVEVTDSKNIILTFYDLLKITYNHAKLPHPPINFFYSLYNNLCSDNLKFFTLRKNSKILIVFVALIFNNCIYAFFIGTNREKKYLSMRPLDLLFWEVMLWGLENGCHIFDWLGAGHPNKEYGVRKFKLQYGGEVLELGRYEKIHKPLLMQFGRFGLKLWQKIKK